MRRPHYSVVTAPVTEPVTLAEASAHLRVDSADDADYITGLISVAREYVDSLTEVSSAATTWRVTAGSFCDLFERKHHRTYQSYIIPLFRSPLVSVTSVKYYAPDAISLTTLDPSKYRVVTYEQPGIIQLIDSPPSVDDRADAIQIEFVAGATATEITKHSIKLMLSHLYENRVPVSMGTSREIPYSLKALITNQKASGYF